MKPEINSIVKDMKSRCKTNPNSLMPLDVNTYNIAQMARLLSLLAEEAETQNAKISDQTDKLVKLTKAIVVFTVVLLVVGAIQIGLMICKP